MSCMVRLSPFRWQRITPIAFFRGVPGLLVITIFLGIPVRAQFTGNIQGTVVDPSGAAVAQVTVDLVNSVTQVTASTTTDSTGSYRFLSLAPGSYKITVEAKGFSKAETTVTLETNQNLNVPISLKVGAAAESVTVTAEAPLLNATETRNEMTLETGELSTLPLAGRSMVSLATLAPGVSGLGTMGGGQPGGAGTPGSGVDNFSTETAVDLSANGQGTVSNKFIIDGLDVTSGIRQGVLNLTPNPDFIQETAIQVNTFSSEYGGSSSIQMASTTKSGTNEFHGLVSDYFNYQNMFAGTEFTHGLPYAGFHSNNISATVGGPIIPHHQFFFFFGVEALRSSASTGNQAITFPDPAFVAWAQTNGTGTFGPKVLNTYKPTGATATGVAKTAGDIFPTTCGTAATNNLPCATPMIDNGVFNSTNFRNGTQYFVRVDKYFKNDRIYGSYFRTPLLYGGPNVIPQFSTTNHNIEYAYQVNETHTFSPTTLNEAILAVNRVQGFIGETGDFTIPSIAVSGINGGNAFYGVGFAQGDFIQHNYHWRDVLTNVRGAHVLKVGYEGWFGDDVEPFEGPWSQPKFSFDNLLDLANDSPHTEGGIMYDPATGKQTLWEWNAASKTWGLFAQDQWKARRNLTLTLGFRFDDQGNPYSRSATTVFGNFYLGSGSTFQQQVANGFAKPTHNALNGSPKAYNPRVGAAWDINGRGDWVLHGGFGVFANWLTQANVQEEFRGNPPGLIEPTFTRGTASPPVFAQGTSSTPPFGFTFPTFAGGLDSKGGIVGANFPIGGINPSLKSPTAYIWAGTLEHKLPGSLVASVVYSGSHSTNLVCNGNGAGLVSYGCDINDNPGDLITSAAPVRLNSSFGSIAYAFNDRVANYNGVTFDLRGRSRRFFFDASYTRSESKDDAGTGGTGYGIAYPTALNPHQFYSASPWDVPNRFSLTFNYELPGLNHRQGAAGRLTGGWGATGTSIYQSGYPLTVWTTAPFLAVCANGNLSNQSPGCSASDPAVSFQSGSGDFNADGDNLDYPNVTSHSENMSRNAYLNTGVFSAGQFTVPTLGTEGNEKPQQFRQPSFVETDFSIYKDTNIAERLKFQMRFEFFNLFNHPNLYLDNNLANGTFGKAVSQQLPRWWQIGGKLSF